MIPSDDFQTKAELLFMHSLIPEADMSECKKLITTFLQSNFPEFNLIGFNLEANSLQVRHILEFLLFS